MHSFGAWFVRTALASWYAVQWLSAAVGSLSSTIRRLFGLAPRAAPDKFAPPTLHGVTVERADRTAWPLFRTSSDARSGKTADDVLLYIHGGGFILEIGPEQWQLAAQLARDTGRDVYVPIYPLHPDRAATAAAMVDGLLELWPRLEQPVVGLVGDSVGAALALAGLQQLRLREQESAHRDLVTRLRCMVFISPFLDMTVARLEVCKPRLVAKWIGKALLEATGWMYQGKLPIEHPLVSPLYGDLSELPPLLIVNGTNDILVSDGRRLCSWYQGQGLDNRVFGDYESERFTHRELPGMKHVEVIMSQAPQAVEAREGIMRFLEKHLRE